jgi:hypothetical protein
MMMDKSDRGLVVEFGRRRAGGGLMEAMVSKGEFLTWRCLQKKYEKILLAHNYERSGNLFLTQDLIEIRRR